MAATPRTINVTADMLLKARVAAKRQLNEGAVPILSGEGLPDVWVMDDLQFRPKPNWLIEQIVEEKGLTIFFGPDKVGKTAMLSSFLWAWAAGKSSWFDTKFQMSSNLEDEDRKVMYVLLEGQAAFYGRYEAWRYAYADDVERLDNFFVIDEGLSLFEQRMRWDDPTTWTASAKGLYSAIEQLRPQILVIDTLSRATAGMDENSPQMAQVVGFLDQLRDEFGVATIIVHHVSLGEGSRPRGHSSLKGAASSYVRIEGKPDEARAKLIVGPHRNAASGNPAEGFRAFSKDALGGSFVVRPANWVDGQRESGDGVRIANTVGGRPTYSVLEAMEDLGKSKKQIYAIVRRRPELAINAGQLYLLEPDDVEEI